MSSSLAYLRHLYAILGFDELRQAIDDYERLLLKDIPVADLREYDRGDDDAQHPTSDDLPHSNDTEHMANEPSPSDPAVDKD